LPRLPLSELLGSLGVLGGGELGAGLLGAGALGGGLLGGSTGAEG